MSFLENWLIPLLENQGLVIVFVTMVAESACILIPSEIVMPYGGFLAAQGHAPLWAVIVVATVANMVGSLIAYYVGRYGGRALFVKYGRYVGARTHHLEQAERWFEKRGDLTVMFARVMPGIRTFISLPAGMVKMPVSKFMLYSLVGITPWVGALVGLGYGAGKAVGDDPWGHLQAQFHRYNEVFFIVLAVAVVAATAWGVRRWRRNRRAKDLEGLKGGVGASPVDESSSARPEDL